MDRSMSSTREITPQNSESKRMRGALSSNGKENVANSRPNSGSSAKMAARAEARNSRMAKPLTAQTIYEQKSVEMADASLKCDSNAKKLCDDMDAEIEPLEPLTSCPIALALRGEDRDYSRIEGVLETKLVVKPATSLKEMKDRIEAQKGVVKELRTVGKALLTRSQEAEKVAAEFTQQHEAAAARVEGERDSVTAERDAANIKVSTITQEKSDGETRLNSALASFAALDEQRKANLEERDSARAQLALKTAAEDSCRKELGQSTHDLAASKSETEQLRTTLETRQIAMDKEMNDMRENLGKEMVAGREANSKLSAATTELTDLRTKYAVTDESLKLSRSEAERLETEKSSKIHELQAAQTEKVRLLYVCVCVCVFVCVSVHACASAHYALSL